MTDPTTAAERNTEAEATAGMGTAARMTRVRAAAKNAFTEQPSTAPPSQLVVNVNFRKSLTEMPVVGVVGLL